jgi:predicted nucleotidyltransferase
MDLEAHLAKQLGVKVDLVPRRALKGDIGARILREVVPI